MRVRTWLSAVICGALLVVLPGAARAAAAAPCWERVIADWSENGRVDGTYPLPCYRQAVQHMPEDLRVYSSAPAEIDRALAERRVERPTSLQVASAPLTTAGNDADGGADLVTLVPSLAGVLAATGVGWWLVRARKRPASER